MADYTTKNLIHDIVYWAPSSYTGIGRTFSNPVAVTGRWVDKSEMFKDSQGREKLSQAVVLISQDVLPGGYLFKGKLADLPTVVSTPDEVSGAYEINLFQKVPNLKGTKTVRKVWL